MANGVYNRGKQCIMTMNVAAQDLRVMLVNSSYTFADTHNFVSDIGNEISVVGYSRQALTSITVTEDDANDFSYLDANDATFSALTTGQTVAGAILYIHNASDAAANIVAYYDVTDTPTNGGDITIQWAAPASGGVLKLA